MSRIISLGSSGTGLEETKLPVNIRDIKFMPPRDTFFDGVNLADNNNVNTNKGEGLVVYFRDEAVAPETALNSTGDYNNYHWLVRFKRIDSPEKPEEARDRYYTIEYNPEYYTDATGGVLKYNDNEKYRLYVDEDNQLCFSIQRATRNDVRRRFAVRPLATNIRPGDDFVLRFALAENETAIGPYEKQYKDAQGNTNDGNYPGFMAVYDKKLLWRANLYIDERKYEDGKWRIPNSRVCEWAELTSEEKDILKKLDWNDVNNWDSDENEWRVAGTPVPGGQCNIRPWTHTIVNSLKDPNWKIYYEQYYVNKKWEEVTPNQKRNIYHAAPYSYASTSFPDYQNQASVNPEMDWFKYSPSNWIPGLGWFNTEYTSNKLVDDKNDPTKTKKIPLYPVDKIPPRQGNDLGLHCWQLIVQANGYDGASADNRKLIKNRDRIVPGDVVFWGSLHVVIIEDVNYQYGIRKVDDSSLEIIHQTTWYGNWYLQKSRFNPMPAGDINAHPLVTFQTNILYFRAIELFPDYQRIR